MEHVIQHLSVPLEGKLIFCSTIMQMLNINPFITNKKKVKSVSSSGDIAQQQAVKLGLSV